MKKISKLKIDRFRGIRDLEIENLTQVNLIVGDNNCGKTSMLEALQFLRSGSAANLFKSPDCAIEGLFPLQTLSMIISSVCFQKTKGS